MTPKMLKGIELMLHGNLSNVEVAKQCGVSENTIYSWLKNDDFLTELQKQQRRAFTKLACKAQQRMAELMDSGNPSIAFAACKEILNKAGLNETIKVDADIDSKVIFEGEDTIAD